MRLLLISNSTNAGEAYLEYPKDTIGRFLAGVDQVVFIPYAAVTFAYDDYEDKVQQRFAELGITVRSLHRYENCRDEIINAKAIVVGGGNTFHLLKNIQDKELMELIGERVRAGVPYVGWSAGSNVACPTICTTNDMPIVEPRSFKATGLIKFQINPHYIDAHPDGHAGETREQRIEEYIAANRDVYVVGLRESSILEIENDNISLIGSKNMRIFRYGDLPREVSSMDDLSFLNS